MTDLLPLAEHLSLETSENGNTLTSPQLYLSSTDAGWEGLVAQAFYEPEEWEGWITSDTSDTSLTLFSGGVMHIEQRYASGPWQAQKFLPGSLILRPEESASYELRWKILSREPVQTLHLQLSQELIVRTLEEVEGRASTRLALVERSGFHDPLLAQIGFALWRELEQQAPAGKLYAQTAARMLIVHLLRHYSSSGIPLKEPSQGLTRLQMRRVMDFVQAHLGQDLSLETLAQQTGFSPYHFARLFRQTTGESPHQFVLRQRIARAQRLLAERDMPVAQVALESGFADQSHFTQVFKRQLGLTPSVYRRDRLR